MAGGPLADYSVAGVQNSWLSTGLSGVIGVVLCFVIAGGVAADHPGAPAPDGRRPASS